MTLDHVELVFGQPPRLVQDRGRRQHLADVVDCRRRADPGDLLGGQPHPSRDHRRVAGNPARVSVQVHVLTLERAR